MSCRRLLLPGRMLFVLANLEFDGELVKKAERPDRLLGFHCSWFVRW